MELILPDGTIYDLRTTPPTGELPDPIVVPDGTRYTADSDVTFGRIKNDLMLYGVSRTALDSWQFNNRTTNMIQDDLEIYYKDGKIRAAGKPNVDVRHSPWWNVMLDLMGEVVLERFTRDGAGFMDNGPDLLYCLPCGGNVVKGIGRTTNRDGYVTILERQKYSDGPTSIDPKKEPHKWIKANLVTTSPKRAYNELVDKGEVGGNGDTWFPAMAENDATISEMFPNMGVTGNLTRLIAFFPKPPFACKLHDVDVVVEELCFWGSNVYGRVEQGWYVLDEMLVRGDPAQPGLAGDMDDRVCNVGEVYGTGKLWTQLLPPGVPEIGWTYKHYPPDYDWVII